MFSTSGSLLFYGVDKCSYFIRGSNFLIFLFSFYQMIVFESFANEYFERKA